MTFGFRHYVPILLTKRGERSAVRDLDPTLKPQMTPLFVVSPVDWNFDLDEPSKTVDAHVRGLGKELATCWGSDRASVDLQFIDAGALMADGSHPLVSLIDEGNQHGAQLIPVVSIGRDPAYRQAASTVVARDGRGACVRLGSDEWPSNTGMGPLNGLLAELNISAGDVDLVLDLSDQVAGAPGLSLTAVRNELIVLPYAPNWRSVSVAGAGFPKQLSDISRGITPIERVEWTVYQALLAGPSLPRTPAFGDYAIAHPDPFVNVDPRYMSISANIRYTINDAWLVAKGQLFKGGGGQGRGGAAIQPLAQAIVSDARFAGTGHCGADDWLATAANGGSGGNPEAWRRIGTLHHLTHVAETVANLP